MGGDALWGTGNTNGHPVPQAPPVAWAPRVSAFLMEWLFRLAALSFCVIPEQSLIHHSYAVPQACFRTLFMYGVYRFCFYFF